MFLKIETNGASHILINLGTDNVQYLQQMVKMVETNMIAVDSGYSGATRKELTCSIDLGKTVVFDGNSGGYGSDPKPALIITSEASEDIVKEFEALPLDCLISSKEILKKFKKEVDMLTKERDHLKTTIQLLQAEREEQEE